MIRQATKIAAAAVRKYSVSQSAREYAGSECTHARAPLDPRSAHSPSAGWAGIGGSCEPWHGSHCGHIAGLSRRFHISLPCLDAPVEERSRIVPKAILMTLETPTGALRSAR